MPLSYQWDFPKPSGLIREVIKRLVCAEYEIDITELCGVQRMRIHTDARMVYSYITRKHLGDTVHRIGVELKKDHTTVVRQLEKIEAFIQVRDPIAKRIARIEKLLNNNNDDNKNQNNTQN